MDADRPLLRATVNDLAIAPELGVLVALDAILAAAAYQLVAAHAAAGLGLDALARGDPPDAEARKASFLVLHIGELRTALRDYRNLTVRGDPYDDRSF
jgi:hypothetical protein